MCRNVHSFRLGGIFSLLKSYIYQGMYALLQVMDFIHKWNSDYRKDLIERLE